jgi:outer membrane protein TolC
MFSQLSLSAPAEQVALPELLQQALERNPEIAAARARATAADARIAPAGALDDPMLEAGIVNAPLSPFSLSREDMTMQMIGLSQRLPYPGKRALRGEVARGEAAALGATVRDTRDQVVRELRMAYEELAAVQAQQQIVADMYATLEEYITIAESRYAVGTAEQTEVLQAQAQLGELQHETIELQGRRTELQATLAQLAAQDAEVLAIETTAQTLAAEPAPLPALLESSRERPRARAVAAQRDRAQHQVALMQRESYPDFDVKLSYGRREDMPDGMPRDPMVSLTVGVNLPIWRKTRIDPQIAEARAMLSESESMLRALELESRAMLTQRYAAAHQSRHSVEVFDTALLPAAQAATNAALAAYRVGTADFLMLLESRMRLFQAQMGRSEAIAEHNTALAELDYLAGRLPAGVETRP